MTKKIWSRDRTAQQEMWEIDGNYVIVSQVKIKEPGHDPYETMCFACDKDGEITNWFDLACHRGVNKFIDTVDFINEYKEQILYGHCTD